MKAAAALATLAIVATPAAAAVPQPKPAAIYHALLKQRTPPPRGYTATKPVSFSDGELAGITALPLAQVRRTFVGAVAERVTGSGDGTGIFYFVARSQHAALDFLVQWRMDTLAGAGSLELLVAPIPGLPVTLTRMTILERNDANGLFLAGANTGPVVVAGIAATFNERAAEQLLRVGLAQVARVRRSGDGKLHARVTATG